MYCRTLYLNYNQNVFVYIMEMCIVVLVKIFMEMCIRDRDCSGDENLHQALMQYCSYTQVPILLDNLSNFSCSQMVWAEPVIRCV